VRQSYSEWRLSAAHSRSAANADDR
jgi:hypothetical protein